MLSNRGWLAESKELAPGIGTVAAVSSTTFIDLTDEDVKPGTLLIDLQRVLAKCHGQTLAKCHGQTRSQRVEPMEPEDAMAQEKARQKKAPNTQRWEDISKVRVKVSLQHPYVKEERVVEAATATSNAPKPTVVDIIDLETYVDVEEQSSDMSMALVMVPDHEEVQVQDHITELAIFRADNVETREVSASQTDNLYDGPNQMSRIHSPITTANGLSVASQPPQGNSCVQAADADACAPRWPTSTVSILTVQCARCRKWRVVPCKEKYEVLREHFLEAPWVCEHAIEWGSDVSCDDPTDVDQNSGAVWALDKPNLPCSPPGWTRKVVVRRDCSTRFADVYYIAPAGKTLRSSVEVARYVEEHPESVPPGTQMSQFSFTSPRPVPGQWNRKKTKTKSVNELTSQECKKAKIHQAHTKQSAQKLLHGPSPATLPVVPSSPSFSVESYPFSMGASFQAGPPLGPDLAQFEATMPLSSHPLAPNFSYTQNMPFFASPLPLRECAPHEIASPNANPESFILDPAMLALRMRQQQPLQQQQSRQRGAIPRSQPWSAP